MPPYKDNPNTYFDYGPQATSESTASTLADQHVVQGGVQAAASNPSSGAAPRIRRRNRMITSCLECRRRKLKCDKSHPCTNCTKFSRDCVFLAPALDTASQLRLTEIKEKMGSLERVLEQDVAMKGARKDARKGAYGNDSDTGEDVDFAPEPEDEKNLEPTPLALQDAVYDDDADDDLMDLGIQLGKLRLTDRLGGFFRPKLSEEITVALIRGTGDQKSPIAKVEPPESASVMLSPHAIDYQSQTRYSKLRSFLAPGPTYIAPTSSFFFAAGSHGSSLIDFLPSKLAADRLLEQYWSAVHPIACIVHRPSFQRRYETFWNEVQLGIEPLGSLQAVVFAAMFSGVVSMPEDVIMRNFGVAKKDLVENFQQGTETALSRANLLRSTKVETLQAFIMYMIPLCRDQMSRAHSALCGTAIRIAECMGLHRDGVDYGLNPIEVHVRRLIWHQICFLDIRTAEAQGPRPSIRKDDFDTKFPLNVNDADLEQYPPPSKSAKYWTDMTLPLIRMECNEMHRVVWVDRPRLQQKKISLTALLGKIENFRRIMHEKYVPMIDDDVPIQHYGRLLLEVLTLRMHIMVLHRYHTTQGDNIPERLAQMTLTTGTEQLEAAVEIETSRVLHQWVWYAGTYQQYTTAFLLLVYLFAHPMRKEAGRIWRILDYVFEVPEDLSRDQKARLILTEIRDRTGIYRDARKLRAPISMLHHMASLPIQPRSPNGSEDMTSQPAPTTSSLYQDYQNFSMLNNENHPGLQSGPASLTGISDNTSSTSPSALPPLNTSDDLMADIDWNEWDRLFPPDFRASEQNNRPFA